VSAQPQQAPPVSLVRLDPSTLERLALRVAAIVTAQLQQTLPQPPLAEQKPPELLTASQVAQWWGLHRGWVYEHAHQLGAIRIGDGERPRLRFDADEVARRMNRPPTRPH
jgi:hypothetical protein